jgi:hypothetical protein
MIKGRQGLCVRIDDDSSRAPGQQLLRPSIGSGRLIRATALSEGCDEISRQCRRLRTQLVKAALDDEHGVIDGSRDEGQGTARRRGAVHKNLRYRLTGQYQRLPFRVHSHSRFQSTHCFSQIEPYQTSSVSTGFIAQKP